MLFEKNSLLDNIKKQGGNGKEQSTIPVSFKSKSVNEGANISPKFGHKLETSSKNRED